jgi:hypothetical protein
VTFHRGVDDEGEATRLSIFVAF